MHSDASEPYRRFDRRSIRSRFPALLTSPSYISTACRSFSTAFGLGVREVSFCFLPLLVIMLFNTHRLCRALSTFTSQTYSFAGDVGSFAAIFEPGKNRRNTFGMRGRVAQERNPSVPHSHFFFKLRHLSAAGFYWHILPISNWWDMFRFSPRPYNAHNSPCLLLFPTQNTVITTYLTHDCNLGRSPLVPAAPFNPHMDNSDPA